MEKEEGIVLMVVLINLDSVILITTAGKSVTALTADAINCSEITLDNRRPGRTAVVVSLSCQASNQHWHPAGCAGQ